MRGLPDAGGSAPDERHLERRLKLGRALERAQRIVPLDRLADSFAQRVFKSRATRSQARARPAPARAGSPFRGSARSARSARRPSTFCCCGSAVVSAGQRAEVIVLGGAVDDAALMATGAIFVTGPAAATDYVELARCYGIEALLAPDRGGGYGDLEATAAALGVRQAYFDWSFGAFPVELGDLSLDPRICDDKAAAWIVAWMNGERQTSE